MQLSIRLKLLAPFFALIALAAGLAMPPSEPARATVVTPQAGSQQAMAAPDCGAAWKRIFRRGIGSSSPRINDVVALTASNMWAVGSYEPGGSYQQPLALHWDGAVWSPVALPNVTLGGRLNAIAAVGPNDIWAVGAVTDVSSSQTLIVHWNGASWVRFASPTGQPEGYNELYGIDARVANDIWSVGDDGGQPIIIHWNGAQWIKVANPPGITQTNHWLRGVTALTANDVWAVGYVVDGAASTLTMHWNGVAWAVVASPNVPQGGNNELRAVDALAPNDIWAVGDGFYQPLVLHWDGISWSIKPFPDQPLGDNTLLDIIALAPNDIWAVGRNTYAALAFHWDGAIWREVSPPRPPSGDGDFRGVAAVSSRNVWVVGTIGIEQYAPSVALTGTAFQADVGGRSAEAIVGLTSTAAQTVTVTYATSDGSAVAGKDYVATSGTLTIPPCQHSAAFTIRLLDSPTWRPLATMNLSLSNPTGAALGTPATLALNVANRDKAPARQAINLPLFQRGAPDAQRIAYSASNPRGPSGITDIWVRNADGSNMQRLISGPGQDLGPAWSPDGRRIAFNSLFSQSSDLFVMNADGSGLTQLTAEAGYNYSPAWSPDSKRIAFTSSRPSRSSTTRNIYVMNADGSGVARLTTGGTDETPAWSPDGRRLAFSSAREGVRAIYVMDADGRNQTRVTSLSAPCEWPAWAPDGRLAFLIETPGYNNIAVAQPDGSQLRLLNPNFQTMGPFSWSSDGQRLTFSDTSFIYVMSVQGGEPVKLQPQQYGIILGPVWEPGSR